MVIKAKLIAVAFMVCILLPGCSSVIEDTQALADSTEVVEEASNSVNEQPLLECIPAYEYRSVLPFRIRLTEDGKLLCSIKGYEDVYLQSVGGRKVELNSIDNGYYTASMEDEVEVVFKDADGKKFKRYFQATNFIEQVADPVFTSSPTFDCLVNGEFVKYSENTQKIKTPYYYGALKGATIKVCFDSSIAYADISLRDNTGREYYPVSVTDGVAVFEAVYIPGDFSVCCPLGVCLKDVSVHSITNGAKRTRTFTVQEASESEQVITFVSNDLTATAKLITPGNDVYYFSRSLVGTTGATYEVVIPKAQIGKYTVVVQSNCKIKKLRRVSL